MGRGTGIRLTLPLLATPPQTFVNLLKLPFVEGGALEVSWDTGAATLQMTGSTLPMPEVTRIVRRRNLVLWLNAMGTILVTPTGPFQFAQFEFRWDRPAGVLPSLYLFGIPTDGKLCLGTLASWEVLDMFLQEARAVGLFYVAS